jgi:hypothetical protein
MNHLFEPVQNRKFNAVVQPKMEGKTSYQNRSQKTTRRIAVALMKVLLKFALQW